MNETIEDLRRAAQRTVEARGRGFRLSQEDREDLLQEVLVRYLRAWPDNAEPDNVEACLETATGHLITDRWRAAQRRPQAAKVDDEDGDPYDVVAEVMEKARSRQPSMPAVGDVVVDQALALVSEEDRRVLIARLLEDRLPAELAEDLGISRAAVDQRLSRAKGRLEAALVTRPDLLAELRAPHPHLYDRGRP